MNNNKPWNNDDMLGVSDHVVGFMYQLAQNAYDVAPYGTDDKQLLGDLITRIGRDKPTFVELCTDKAMATKWYDLLRKYDRGLSELLTIVEDELEDFLGIEHVELCNVNLS